MKEKVLLELRDLRDFLKTFLLKNKAELYLLIGLLVIYLPYSVFVVYNTCMVDPPIQEADLYFSFDNPMILKYGRTQLTGHPLLMIFYYPFVLLGNLLTTFLGMKAKTILFVVLSSTLISMSCVYVYRYLVEIVELGKKLCLLIALFYALFSTNLILVFTPESFTLSAFFLTFSVYYYSAHIKRSTKPTMLSSIVLGVVCLGGVTITNVAKGILPIFFLKEKNKFKLLLRAVVVGTIFLSILIILQVWFDEARAGKDFFRSMEIHRENFTLVTLEGLQYIDIMFSHFFGSPILFPALEEYIFYNNSSGILEHMIKEGDYTMLWQYLYVGILLCAIVLTFVKNWNNRFVLLLFALLSVDVGIHCVMKFGLTWPFMYGAHWVYCIPLLIGWLLKKLNGAYFKVGTAVFIALFAILAVNNIIRLYQFIELGMRMYPPI